MRKILIVVALAGAAVLASPAVPAQANPLPNPTDCHELQEFLHIYNVQDCNAPHDS